MSNLSNIVSWAVAANFESTLSALRKLLDKKHTNFTKLVLLRGPGDASDVSKMSNPERNSGNRQRSPSPKFLQQRKIAYVDNPFDEQVSVSMQKCDIKYLNLPRTEQIHANKEVIANPITERENDKENEKIWRFTPERESCDSSDWSSLFSPVQVISLIIYFKVLMRPTQL